MSLLNQVLQDLEKRNANNSTALQDSSLLEQVKAAEQKSTKNHYLVAISLFAVIGIAYAGYQLLPGKTDTTLTKVKTAAFTKKPVITKPVAQPIIKSEPPVLKIKEAIQNVALPKKQVITIKLAAKKSTSKQLTVLKNLLILINYKSYLKKAVLKLSLRTL